MQWCSPALTLAAFDSLANMLLRRLWFRSSRSHPSSRKRVPSILDPLTTLQHCAPSCILPPCPSPALSTPSPSPRALCNPHVPSPRLHRPSPRHARPSIRPSPVSTGTPKRPPSARPHERALFRRSTRRAPPPHRPPISPDSPRKVRVHGVETAELGDFGGGCNARPGRPGASSLGLEGRATGDRRRGMRWEARDRRSSYLGVVCGSYRTGSPMASFPVLGTIDEVNGETRRPESKRLGVRRGLRWLRSMLLM